jgi:hypothetical protein
VNVGAVIITKDEDFVVRKMLESGPAGDFRKASPEVASSE